MKVAIAAAFGLTLLALALPGAAAARPPLVDNRPIVNQLFAAAVGDMIRRECPTISARMFTVMRKARALEARARREGYSDDEIAAFLDSEANRDWMKRKAAHWLAERGARPGDAAAHCRVGEAEIAAKSPIGELLRNR